MTELYNFESSLKRLLGRIETLETDKEPLKKWYLDLKSAKQVADVIVQRAGL